MAIEEKLEAAVNQREKLTILTTAIRTAMDMDRTEEECLDGRFALGFLVSWVKESLR